MIPMISPPPIDLSAIQPLIQKKINLMETVSCWTRKAAKKAHIVGLQGEKRRLRWLSREARNIVDGTEHAVLDHFGLDLCAEPGTVDVSSLICPMSTMNGIISKLWIIRNETHQIANDLVIAKAKKYSNCLYTYAEELDYILIELQRTQKEYEMADYEYHHISRYQLGWCNVHDKYECMEETQGYFDRH